MAVIISEDRVRSHDWMLVEGAVGMRGRSRFVSIADQGLNSVSNFALVAFAAMGSSAPEFGQFSISYAFFTFLLGLGRALVGETALVHESSDGRTAPVSAIIGAALLPAVPGAILLCGIGAFTQAEYRSLWFVLAGAVLVALVQDAIRYALLVQGRPDLALMIDGVWTVPALGAMGVSALVGASAAVIAACWAGAALISAVVGCLTVRVLPNPVAGTRWLLMHRTSSTRYALEFSSLNASTLVVWVVLAPILGVAGVGALRGAQLLMSPLNTVFSSLRIAMIPELIRVRSTDRFRSRLIEYAAILAGTTVLWSGLILVLNDGLGGSLLGATWDGAAPLRAAYVAQYVFMAVYTLLLTLFRVDRLNRQSSVMRAVLAVLTLAGPTLLALAVGTGGAAWGFTAAVAASVGTGIFLLRGIRR